VTDKPKLTVVTKIDKPNQRDIPAMLRNLADQVERGDETNARFVLAVVVRDDNTSNVFGAGEYTSWECAGALSWSAMRVGQPQ